MGELHSGATRVATQEVMARGAKAAAGLKVLGVERGDCVAVYMRNDITFFEALVAVQLLGGYPVPVNWHYTVEEAVYLLGNCQPKAIIIHADLLAQVRPAMPAGTPLLVVETPEEIAQAYGIAPAACAVRSGDTAWDAWRDANEPIPPVPLGPPASVFYTSGTTGHPKGVRRNPPTEAEAGVFMDTLETIFGFKGEDPAKMITAVTGPMYHSAPNAYAASIFRLGGKVILQPRFDPEAFLAMTQEHKLTHVHMVPTMFVRLLKLPEAVRARYDLSSLRFVVHAAAPCPPDIKDAMIQWLGPIINEYYGSTEVGGIISCTAQEWLAHRGTVGRPLPNTAIKIFDDNGKEMPQGEEGEVFMWRQGMVDFTYIGDDAKRQASEREGLITAGDVGYLDKDGFLYLCDRRRDMIISGGVNIYPIEIENVLHGMPGVEDCAVFGIPNDEFGESVCAVVQPRAGVSLSEDAVRSFVGERLARFKVPHVVEMRQDLPREDSGKIFKRKLRDPWWEKAGRRI